MKVLNNVWLSEYTTFRMGGMCKSLYIPDSEEELIQIVKEKNDCRFIGNGSNLLINDEAVFDNVILLKQFSNYINCRPDGITESSASVSLAKLLKHINVNGYGGIEYLSSVPGLVGGAIYMNAGRGRSVGCSISDYINTVRALCIREDDLHHHPGEIVSLTKEDCCFEYRKSRFQANNYLILSAEFCFPKVEKEESDRLILERKEWCRKTQDYSGPNFGSVFYEQNSKLMRIVKELGLGRTDGVHFSKNVSNWMINSCSEKQNFGAFKETIRLIEKVKKFHRIFGKKCEAEVIIWEN